MRTWLGCFSAVTAAWFASTANADVYFVDHEATGTGGGLSWPNAFTTLQAALDIADISNGPDIIRIADGVYQPSSPSGRNATFLMEVGLRIEGGWAGVSNQTVTEPDPSVYITVLSGDLNGDDTIGDFVNDRDDNTYHVVTANDDEMEADDTLLIGVTIRGGAGSDGGGIRITSGASPLIRNCIITDNSGADGGGAYIHISTPTFRECQLIGNRAFHGGGGLRIDTCSPIVVQCEFIKRESGVSGGGFRDDQPVHALN